MQVHLGAKSQLPRPWSQCCRFRTIVCACQPLAILFGCKARLSIGARKAGWRDDEKVSQGCAIKANTPNSQHFFQTVKG